MAESMQIIAFWDTAFCSVSLIYTTFSTGFCCSARGKTLHITICSYRSWGSSVSIMSDYGLDDRAIGVRSPAGAKDFSSNFCVQTGSEEAHPASCTMGTRGPFPGAKCGWGMTLTTHPQLVPRSAMSKSYTSSPPSVSVECSRTALLYV
jgi:hypothetical protein